MLELLLSLFISHAHAQAVSPPKKPNEVRCHLASVFSASDNPIIGRLASTIQLSDTSGTCSGSLVTLKGRSKSEKALVLTRWTLHRGREGRFRRESSDGR